jgi:hypothetical protein
MGSMQCKSKIADSGRDHPDMVVSMTSPTGAAGAAASAASRREKMTSLITWAISPCCASAAILVLQGDRISAYTLVRYMGWGQTCL